MPRAIARDKNGILYTTDPETNQWRALTSGERGSLSPVGVLDEFGVTGGERLTIKNLPPSLGLMFLRAKGYEALQYGDGLNFAVRRSAEEPWKLVDPMKGGIEEVWRDFTDLLGDIGVGAATVLGTASGGGIASIATGAASGAAAELARQNIARAAAGFEPGVDIGGVAGAAIGGGIAPPIGKAVGAVAGKVVRGIAGATRPGGAVGRFGEVIATKVGGVKPLQGVEVSEILLETAARRGAPVFRPADLVQLFRQHIGEVASKDIGAITAIRDAAITPDLTVNLTAFAKPLKQLTGLIKPGEILAATAPAKAALQEAAIGILTPPSKAAVAMSLPAGTPLEAIDQAFQTAVAGWERSLAHVPAKIALRVKKVLQDAASSRGGFGTVGAAQPGAVAVATKEETRALSSFVGRFNDELHGQLPKKIAQLDKLLSLKQAARNKLRDLVGEDVTAAENTIRNAFSPGREHIKATLAAYDRAFPGLRFTKIAQQAAGKRVVPGSLLDATRQTAIGSRMTPIPGAAEEFGLPGPVAKIAATGQFLGSALIGGGAGFALGGPMGALTGAAVAPFLLSPAMLVKLAPHTTALNALVNRMATGAGKVQMTDALRHAIQLLGTSAAQATGRRIINEDAQGRRRAVFMGD